MYDIAFITYSNWNQAGDSLFSESFLKDIVKKYKVVVIGPAKPKIRVDFRKLSLERNIFMRLNRIGSISSIKAKKHLKIPDYKILIIDHLRTYLLAKKYTKKNKPVIYLSHNFEFKNLIENLKYNLGFKSIIKFILNFRIFFQEKRIRKHYLVIDADLSSSECIYFPLIHKNNKDLKFNSKGGLLYVGNLTWYPNIIAVKKYLIDIYNIVKSEIHIIGKISSTEKNNLIKKYPFVKVHGFVDDISSLNLEISSMLVLCELGSGIKIKFISSLLSENQIIFNSYNLNLLPKNISEEIQKISKPISKNIYKIIPNKKLHRKLFDFQKNTLKNVYSQIDLLIK